jgi:hypothetical protein
MVDQIDAPLSEIFDRRHNFLIGSDPLGFGLRRCVTMLNGKVGHNGGAHPPAHAYAAREKMCVSRRMARF